MEDNISYSAFGAFRPHFNALERVAYFKIVLKSLSPIRHATHEVFRKIVWFMVLVYNLQHFIRVIQVRHSVDQIVDVLFILLTTLNTLGKQIAFNARSDRIQNIIGIINGPQFSAKKPYHIKVMKEDAAIMHRLLKIYIGCVLICGVLWTIFPLVNKALGVDIQFTAFFPFDTNSSPTFEWTLAYMSILITFQAYGNVTMDCTIVAFYAQAKVQLQILRYNLEHLVDFNNEANDLPDAKSKSKSNRHVVFKDLENERTGELLQTRLISCVVHRQRILWFMKEIESIFAEALLFQFFVTAWVICMTVYKIVGLNLLSAEFISIAMYLGCMLAQFFIYCYYGTQVRDESEFVNQSAYCGDWLSLSPAFRRQLVLMMVNCSRPLVPRTAYIIPISLETYIAVLRASYTLFTFLERK